MAAVYVNGKLTPYAAALSILKHAQGGRRLEVERNVVSKLRAANVSVLAWQPSEDNRFASVLLTNLDHYNTGPLRISVSEFFSAGFVSGVVGASRVAQRKLDGEEVDGLQGLASEVQLEGFVTFASQAFCSDGKSDLPALEPYQTVLLAVLYDEGERIPEVIFTVWEVALIILGCVFLMVCLVRLAYPTCKTKSEVTEESTQD